MIIIIIINSHIYSMIEKSKHATVIMRIVYVYEKDVIFIIVHFYYIVLVHHRIERRKKRLL